MFCPGVCLYRSSLLLVPLHVLDTHATSCKDHAMFTQCQRAAAANRNLEVVAALLCRLLVTQVQPCSSKGSGLAHVLRQLYLPTLAASLQFGVSSLTQDLVQR
jgi:hypothetical protein